MNRYLLDTLVSNQICAFDIKMDTRHCNFWSQILYIAIDGCVNVVV